jgi:cell division control protein 7
LLTILARRFPFFNSADDVEAMIEIASIFGQKKMKACAILHGAVFQCTLPTIGDRGYSLAHIIQWSTCPIRPEDGEGLDQETQKTVKFLESLLELDPRKRFSARGALASEYLMEEGSSETEEEQIDIL